MVWRLYKGKWLTVIALDPDDVIHKYSNGCGDAMAWCLGAPGVDISTTTPTADPNLYSSIIGDTGTTDIAAAHVTGAIAVLKSAFPTLTPTQLVSVILATADDLGVPGIDEVYGHGALNLARATAPVGEMAMVAPDGTGLGGRNHHR